jgi:hypothetical protein
MSEDAVEVPFNQLRRRVLLAKPAPARERILVAEEPALESDHLGIPHLGPVALDDLDSVVLGRVVGGRDHRAGRECVADNVLEGRRRQYAAVDDIAACGHQPGLERVHEERPRGAGVPSDRDRSRPHRAERLPDPEHEPRCHRLSHDAAHAVRPEDLLLLYHGRPHGHVPSPTARASAARATPPEDASQAINAIIIVPPPA